MAGNSSVIGQSWAVNYLDKPHWRFVGVRGGGVSQKGILHDEGVGGGAKKWFFMTRDGGNPDPPIKKRTSIVNSPSKF